MTIPATQAEVADLLLRETGAETARETPISAVFVGAARVLKLRKAIRKSFLDFSPLAEREWTARREFELNAPHAPGLYRGVFPVTREAGGLAIDGSGETVDWIVEMARVPEADFFPELAERGALSPTLLDQLADAVVDYHDTCPVVGRDLADSLAAAVDGNREAAVAAGLPKQDVAEWHAGITEALDTRRDWLAHRVADGFVRRVHGDLHLGNICLWRGRPTAFDALEFDEALAETDVAYDLAFLLMDLERRLDRAAANRVMNRAIARTGDHDLVRGLPVYLSLRAMVRAHVSLSAGDAAAAHGYFAVARAALQPVPARVIAIGGLPGTGKSTVARAIAPRLGAAPGALVVRSDEVRKRRQGVAPETRLPPKSYTQEENRAVAVALAGAVREAAAAGHAVIADATFLDARDRAEIARAAGGAPFTGVWLTAPAEVLEARIGARHGDASDADVAVLRRMLSSNPKPPDEPWITLDAREPGLAERVLRSAGGG